MADQDNNDVADLIKDSPIPDSPVIPTTYDGEHVISFRCHKDIGCFNACCKNSDITLTPYDIIRLKKHLGMTSSDFLKKYTVPYEMEKDGMAGVRFLPVENGTACQLLSEEGCTVYEDRPTSCRYYPIGLLSMRKQDEYVDRQAYALVKEEHCLGHNEDNKMTIDEYRKQQGVEEYDEIDRGWRQLILKRKSSGPGIGTLTKQSLQLFFMACYDLDRFRLFVTSSGFKESFQMGDAEFEQIQTDDIALLHFGFRLLRQVLFGESSIDVKDGVTETRAAAKKERDAVKAEANPVDPDQPSPDDNSDMYTMCEN
ncbi:YkgJ family cysteine cluster protein [Candidatus Venteria ishoeyi]|uniref:Flagellin N-methylase n=1 Tax=Candidatus Venteria ishoeyi TaxID=1899563 RepID=A0A1H6FBX0_9GAMM|nr:YkgJ family cysteine cluster protein [Candidatus Venteria ishoeyi]SEH07547.1 Flagellin N-methylase [Candidatus Venteria ishoeyi]